MKTAVIEAAKYLTFGVLAGLIIAAGIAGFDHYRTESTSYPVAGRSQAGCVSRLHVMFNDCAVLDLTEVNDERVAP